MSLCDPLAGKVLRKLEAHPGFFIESVAQRTDGRLLATAADDGTVRVWDTASGKQWQAFRLCPRGGHIAQVAFAPDGRHLATANGNGTIYVLRLRDTPGRN